MPPTRRTSWPWLTGLDVAYDPRLREIDFGEREGLTFEESLARFPERDGPLAAVGGGAVPRRARPIRRPPSGSPPRSTDVIAAMGGDDTVVVASHGGAMRVGTCRFLGFPRAQWNAFGGFANCNWAVLFEGRHGWRIDEWNAGSLPEPVMGDDEPDPAGTAARYAGDARSCAGDDD